MGAQGVGDQSLAPNLQRQLALLAAQDQLAQRHLALFDQPHEGNAGDRLGHRRDAEQRFGLQRLAGRPRLPPADRQQRHFVARDQHLHMRQFAALHIGPVQMIDQRVQPVGVHPRRPRRCCIRHLRCRHVRSCHIRNGLEQAAH